MGIKCISSQLWEPPKPVSYNLQLNLTVGSYVMLEVHLMSELATMNTCFHIYQLQIIFRQPSNKIVNCASFSFFAPHDIQK